MIFHDIRDDAKRVENQAIENFEQEKRVQLPSNINNMPVVQSLEDLSSDLHAADVFAVLTCRFFKQTFMV